MQTIETELTESVSDSPTDSESIMQKWMVELTLSKTK